MNWRSRDVLHGLLAGVGITIPAVFGAVASSCAGHGHYVFARIAFPYSILFAFGEITPPLIAVALVSISDLRSDHWLVSRQDLQSNRGNDDFGIARGRCALVSYCFRRGQEFRLAGRYA
jgi:hypothetical protein